MSNYNFNSPKNQRIKDAFVNREVYACITDFSDHLFGFDGKYAGFDEFENIYVMTCPDCGKINSFDFNEHESDDNETTTVWFCKEYGHEEESEPETEPQEIYGFWIVSPWFGAKLRDAGVPILERMMGWIWGRTCAGQAISLDNVIDDICWGMEILEGQQHEWPCMT